MKPGILLAAKQANAWVVTFSWESDRYWELNTWDKFRIPKPFSTIKLVWGTPIPPEDIETKLNELQP